MRGRSGSTSDPRLPLPLFFFPRFPRYDHVRSLSTRQHLVPLSSQIIWPATPMAPSAPGLSHTRPWRAPWAQIVRRTHPAHQSIVQPRLSSETEDPTAIMWGLGVSSPTSGFAADSGWYRLIASDNGVPATLQAHFEMDGARRRPVPKLGSPSIGQNRRISPFGRRLVDTVSTRGYPTQR